MLLFGDYHTHTIYSRHGHGKGGEEQREYHSEQRAEGAKTHSKTPFHLHSYPPCRKNRGPTS